jgi:hypothetical protein
MSKARLETFLRELIMKGDESDKVEMKSFYDLSQKRDRIRLLKCIAAIANSDSTYFENTGYIILGAERGKLVGRFDALEKDSTSADIQTCVRDYIEPNVTFSVERFKDPDVGWWGVIVIPTSSETYVFRQEYSYQKLTIRRGDIYVRAGDSIRLADKSDHDRLQRRKFQNILIEFRDEIETLKEEIKKQKDFKPDMKIFFVDEKSNLVNELEVHPRFVVKTKEEYERELSEDKIIKEIKDELYNLINEIDKLKIEGVSFPLGHNRANLEDYEKALKAYLDKLTEYKISYSKYLSLYSQIISLNFALSNIGNSLAEGITFYVYFPNNLRVSKKLDFFNMPEFNMKKPIDPRRSPFADFFNTKLLFPEVSPLSFPPVMDFTYGGPHIDKSDESIAVKYWANKLLHQHSHNFDPVHLVSPHNEIDISLKYLIYAENVTGEFEGKLLLKIRPKQ